MSGDAHRSATLGAITVLNTWVRMALLVALSTAAIAGGISAAHFLGSGHDGISEADAIAIAQREIQGHDAEATVIAARTDRFDRFWYHGETDFAVPPAQRVWAVAFRGTFSGSCGPVPPAGEQAQCAPPNTTMMVILNYRDGGLIEEASPASGFENTYSNNGPDSGVGIIPEGTDFCPVDAYSQSGYLVRVGDAADVAADKGLRPFLLASAPAELAPLGLDRLWVAQSEDRTQLPPGSTVVPLDLLARDPALHSCDYHLGDKPLARALRGVASGFLADHGIATQQELSEPSVVWMTSDSDLPEGALALYTLLQWPGRVPSRTVV